MPETHDTVAYSRLIVKAIDEDKRQISGVATTPTPDRENDVVDPMGLTFRNPIPLLRMHKSDCPVGTAVLSRPTKDGINFTASLPKIDEPGELQERVDMAWQEVKLGLVRGVSIGFRSSEYSFMDDGGIRWMAGEVLELSLVSIPANPDATITQIRSVGQQERAASGKRTDRPQRPPAGAPAPQPVKAVKAGGHQMRKPLAEQISDFEATLGAKNARQDEIMDKAAERGETMTQEEMDEYKSLEGEIKAIEQHLVLLQDRQKRVVANAKEVQPSADPAPRPGVQGVARSVPAQVKSSENTYGFARMLAARFIAREVQEPAHQIAQQKGWGDSVVSALKLPRDVIEKAAIGAANTYDTNWASALVQYQVLQSEFIDLLRPASIISRIPGLRRVPFKVKIPRSTTGNTAYWVGEGSPVPLSAGALDTVSLDFSKVAGLTFQTMELMRLSQPGSEALLTENLVQAITYLVDRDFLDPAKAASTGVSPASITNGASSITATGTTADAFRSDMASLLSLYTQANSSLSGMVIVMSETQALRLSLMRTDLGVKEFPDLNVKGGLIEGFAVLTSENVVANGGSPADGSIIVALNAREILLADDGQVEVDISTEASIQTDSAPDSPQTASTVLVSLWQQNLVGIKCTRMINWTKARSTSAAYITGGNYR